VNATDGAGHMACLRVPGNAVADLERGHRGYRPRRCSTVLLGRRSMRRRVPDPPRRTKMPRGNRGAIGKSRQRNGNGKKKAGEGGEEGAGDHEVSAGPQSASRFLPSPRAPLRVAGRDRVGGRIAQQTRRTQRARRKNKPPTPIVFAPLRQSTLPANDGREGRPLARPCTNPRLWNLPSGPARALAAGAQGRGGRAPRHPRFAYLPAVG
jgi:hypothetical protein